MTEAFWETLCPYLPLFSVMFMVSVVLLVLLALSLQFITSSSPAFYISTMTFAVLVPSLAGTAIVIRKCRAFQK